MTKIGAVVHGPEVIDSGSAQKVLKRLQNMGSVTAVLGGTMGRVAVIDAGLEEEISISRRNKPSQSIGILQSSVDLIVLLCQAKTRETGLAFGAAVACNAAAVKPVVQIDCGGEFVAKLTETADEAAKAIADLLGLELLALPVFSQNFVMDGLVAKRRLTGVLVGEMISVDGVVVAKATDCFVEIHVRDGKIVDILGACTKRHGIEKLPGVDLQKATVRSGLIRRTEGRPKVLDRRGEGAALIDHCAEEVFEAAKGACLAVTVGDDTTAIAGDILARLSIPVIGIVDGDIDQLSHRTTMAPGSIIIRVEPCYDDIIGRRIKDEIFRGARRAPLGPNDMLDLVLKIAGDRILQYERRDI